MSWDKQEVYQSSTRGDIPLSFTGRRLLANLRSAIYRAFGKTDETIGDEWKPISEARADLAEYMSKLENRVHAPIECKRDHLDDSTKQKADAWSAVYSVLYQHNPKISGSATTGCESALKEIRRLQALDVETNRDNEKIALRRRVSLLATRSEHARKAIRAILRGLTPNNLYHTLASLDPKDYRTLAVALDYLEEQY